MSVKFQRVQAALSNCPSFLAELLREHRRVLEGRLAPLLRDITDSRPRMQEEMKNVYQMIVSYVLLSSGLGSPTDIEVVREVIGP